MNVLIEQLVSIGAYVLSQRVASETKYMIPSLLFLVVSYIIYGAGEEASVQNFSSALRQNQKWMVMPLFHAVRPMATVYAKGAICT